MALNDTKPGVRSGRLESRRWDIILARAIHAKRNV